MTQRATEAEIVEARREARLIEAGFPCHQVGAETQRERGASSALPPLYFLHVWWARRPLTPSRAAVMASLLPEDADPDQFLRDLGIEKIEALVDGEPWTLEGPVLKRLVEDADGSEWLEVDGWVERWLEQEQERRAENRETIHRLREGSVHRREHPILEGWEADSQPLPTPFPSEGDRIPVRRVPGDPALVQARLRFAGTDEVKAELGKELRWDDEDSYGYRRAFTQAPVATEGTGLTVLDPTAGGGSIPFEALRLGHDTIANELNPVAAVILHATIDSPARFGEELHADIEGWGERLVTHVEDELAEFYPFSPLPEAEHRSLKEHVGKTSDLLERFGGREHDQQGLLFCRQVTCPHCGGDAPLLNTCWLSKKSGNRWGVEIVPDGASRNGTVRFETYRVQGGTGPRDQDPDFSTVTRGTGLCVHCRQAIDGDEIKSQARGESEHGTWTDRLYCVVAERHRPELDEEGNAKRYKSGKKEGQIRTKRITFFRPPNERDLEALNAAERRLEERWDEWEREGLIPTERLPDGQKTSEPLRYGMERWDHLFNPRQLLGHLTAAERLNELKPRILEELGEERGRAVVTYLQFALDKILDYNSRQTTWEYTREIVKHTFGRHDFSLKWTFGEMIFSGPSSGLNWGLSQILDAYDGIADLAPAIDDGRDASPSVTVLQGTAAHMPKIADGSVDLVCMDPPYYDNVQYGELSDYFYVWQKRTLSDLHPEIFQRRLTNKTDEAVANPTRDGSREAASAAYERMMGEIFEECRRVLSDDGLMTVMFTHKSQEAWEALTRSLIEHDWIISSAFPVESEGGHSIHQMEIAAAASSIFLTCRKRARSNGDPSAWSGFAGSGVSTQVREAVAEGLEEFEPLDLNPVDEMVAAYGRALRVLSRRWPVLDGDEPVTPMRAMTEASGVVAEHQIRRITDGRLQVEDLVPEAAMALTLYGIYGLASFPYDSALVLSRSLGIALETKHGGYSLSGRMIGVNSEGSSGRGDAEETGYHAPLLRSGSDLRLARPGERSERRLAQPQTEWDVMQGAVREFRKGDVPVARAYLDRHTQEEGRTVLDLLEVWTTEAADEDLRREGQALLFGLR